MRNLKRVLSLALALVMILGMMITGAGAASADFSDSAEIDYTEAVDVMTGLNVLQGSDDDKNGVMDFKPKQLLTREQAAKILAYIVLGKEAADKLPVNQVTTFEDVALGRWSAGFIAWCAGQGILTGDENGNFNPENYLTGLQFGKMLLVAAGYKSDMEGYEWNKDWATNIGSDMVANGIDLTKDGVLMADYLTREQAAQMMLQALDMDMVYYTTGNVIGNVGPYDAGMTFAQKWFPGLVKFSGVITANEWADLYSTAALDEGETEIDGEVYEYTSDLTKIGLSTKGWANDGKVIHIVYTTEDDSIFETGDYADISTSSRFRSVTGMSDAAEDFINFAERNVEEFKPNIRIVYSTDGTAETVVELNPRYSYNVSHVETIRSIFYDDDYANGWVLVGTTYEDIEDAVKDDISNTMRFRDFEADYIDYDGADNTYDVEYNGNGDWLRVIDTDNDGDADYVLQTTFTMAEVSSLTSRGVLTLTDDVTDHQLDETVSFGGSNIPFATDSELARGDVVLYTVIDGKAYVELAPSFTGTVDKYTYKTYTLTVEGVDYVESDIEEHTGFYYELEDALKNTEYTYYLDWFNHIRVYADPANVTGDLVLLADGFFSDGRVVDTYGVNAYLDGEFQDRDVNDRATGGFIYDDDLDLNDWYNLYPFGYYDFDIDEDVRYYDGDYEGYTNLARYSEDEDGVLSLSTARTYNYGKKGQITAIATDYVELDIDANIRAGQTAYEGTYALTEDDGVYVSDPGTYVYESWVAEDDDNTAIDPDKIDVGDVIVQTNKNTVYYYVSWVDADDDPWTPAVKVVTGVKNSLAVDVEEDVLIGMYAVATNVSGDISKDAYWVADAIVVETVYPVYGNATEVTLVYEHLNKTVKDYVAAETIENDASLGNKYIFRVDGNPVVNYNGLYAEGVLPTVDFYLTAEIDAESGEHLARTIDDVEVEGDYARYGIFVATIDRAVELYEYVVAVGGTDVWYDEDTVVYDLYTSGGYTYARTTNASGSTLRLTTGNTYIFYAPLTRGSNDAVYAILVNGDAQTDALYDAIFADAGGSVTHNAAITNVELADTVPNTVELEKDDDGNYTIWLPYGSELTTTQTLSAWLDVTVDAYSNTATWSADPDYADDYHYIIESTSTDGGAAATVKVAFDIKDPVVQLDKNLKSYYEEAGITFEQTDDFEATITLTADFFTFLNSVNAGTDARDTFVANKMYVEATEKLYVGVMFEAPVGDDCVRVNDFNGGDIDYDTDDGVATTDDITSSKNLWDEHTQLYDYFAVTNAADTDGNFTAAEDSWTVYITYNVNNDDTQVWTVQVVAE